VTTQQGGPIIIRKRYYGQPIGSISTCSCWPRYSEFYDLREKLVAAFPHSKSALPALPPKSFVCMGEGFQNWVSKLTAVLRTDRFQRKFLEKRRSGLSYFLKYVRVHCLVAREKLTEFSCVMLNPEFAGSAIVKEFIFA
jgi:hypothetical protein